MKNKKLLIHFQHLLKVLKEYSKHINNVEHSVNKGTAREALISNFLSLNLSELISFHTGELFDTYDHYSGQIDLVLHPKSSPKLNLYGAINIFPIETVLAAIEVKSTLTTGSLFFDKYIFNENSYSEIELIEQIGKGKNFKGIKKHIEENVKKKSKSGSHFASALRTCLKVKRLKKHSNQKDKIPFILFAYNYNETNENLITKIKEWCEELQNQYSKIYFSRKTFEKLYEIEELKNKFNTFIDYIFVDEQDFIRTIKKHITDNNINEHNLYEICKNVEKHKYSENEILNFLPDIIVLLNNRENKSFIFELKNKKDKTSYPYAISDENVLFKLFSFINNLGEKWFANQEDHFFPAKYYTNNSNAEQEITNIENKVHLAKLFNF